MTATEVTNWVIDAGHSTFEFSIRHMKVSTIKGAFNGVRGAIEFDPDNIEVASVQAEIDVASLDTHSTRRDDHLMEEAYANYPNIEKFPTATFVSTRVEPVDERRFKVTGNLTLNGMTNEVTFDTTWQGVQNLPNGTPRTAFYAMATIKRTAFGFSPGIELEGGGFSLSDEVDLAMYTTCNPEEE